MKFARRGFLTLLISLIAFGSVAYAADPAEESARNWLQLVDGGKFADSWDGAGKMFRDAIKKEQWAEQVRAARGPLGKLQTRTLKSAKPAKELPGAPDGDYVVLVFDASLENKKAAIETVTVVKESDGKLRVVGYFIR